MVRLRAGRAVRRGRPAHPLLHHGRVADWSTWATGRACACGCWPSRWPCRLNTLVAGWLDPPRQEPLYRPAVGLAVLISAGCCSASAWCWRRAAAARPWCAPARAASSRWSCCCAGPVAFMTLRGLTALFRVGSLDTVGVELPTARTCRAAGRGPGARHHGLGVGPGAGGLRAARLGAARPEFRTVRQLLGGLGIGSGHRRVCGGCRAARPCGRAPADAGGRFLATNSGRMEALPCRAGGLYARLLLFLSDASKVLTIGIVAVLGMFAGSAAMRWPRAVPLGGLPRHRGHRQPPRRRRADGRRRRDRAGLHVGQGLSGVSTLALGACWRWPASSPAPLPSHYQSWRMDARPDHEFLRPAASDQACTNRISSTAGLKDHTMKPTRHRLPPVATFAAALLFTAFSAYGQSAQALQTRALAATCANAMAPTATRWRARPDPPGGPAADYIVEQMLAFRDRRAHGNGHAPDHQGLFATSSSNHWRGISPRRSEAAHDMQRTCNCSRAPRWPRVGTLGLAAAPRWAPRRQRRRVVVVGGGYGGATAAKYVRLLSDTRIDVMLIEPNARSSPARCPTWCSAAAAHGRHHRRRTTRLSRQAWRDAGARHGGRHRRRRRRRSRWPAAPASRYDKLVLSPAST